MLTTLHLLLGQRRPHELPDNYLSQDHTLLLHKALLTWLITGTPPPLWELGCLNEDISPPPLASTGPYIRQSIAATIADPKGRYWRPTYPTPQIRDPPQRHPPTESHDKAHSTQGKTLPQPKGRPPVQPRGTSLDKNGGTALSLRTGKRIVKPGVRTPVHILTQEEIKSRHTKASNRDLKRNTCN